MAQDDETLPEALERKVMPGGGEVVHGELAERALDAVGARAMTLDNTIFVRDDFDENDAEDLALYTHEEVHLEGSGGNGPHVGDHDAEETLARDVERKMLLHLRNGGTYAEAKEQLEEAKRSPSPLADDPSDPMSAYRALRRSGLEHGEIVIQLGREICEDIRRERSRLHDRGGSAGERNAF